MTEQSNIQKCVTLPSLNDVNVPFPSYSDIHAAMTKIYAIPSHILKDVLGTYPPNIHMPTIPSLPSPIFKSTSMPSMEAMILAGSMYARQFMSVIKSVISKVTDYVSLPLPKMPTLNLDFNDLMDGTSDTLSSAYTRAKTMIGNDVESVKQFFNSITGSSFNLFDGLNFPDQSDIIAMQLAVTGYIGKMTSYMQEILGKFTKYLKDIKMGDFSVPTLPTFSSFDEMLAKVKIPNFHLSLGLPDPLLPDINMPSINSIHMANVSIVDMYGKFIKELSEFSLSLPIIGSAIKLPTLSDTFGLLPTIPRICHTEMPSSLINS